MYHEKFRIRHRWWCSIEVLPAFVWRVAFHEREPWQAGKGAQASPATSDSHLAFPLLRVDEDQPSHFTTKRRACLIHAPRVILQVLVPARAVCQSLACQRKADVDLFPLNHRWLGLAVINKTVLPSFHNYTTHLPDCHRSSFALKNSRLINIALPLSSRP